MALLAGPDPKVSAALALVAEARALGDVTNEAEARERCCATRALKGGYRVTRASGRYCKIMSMTMSSTPCVMEYRACLRNRTVNTFQPLQLQLGTGGRDGSARFTEERVEADRVVYVGNTDVHAVHQLVEHVVVVLVDVQAEAGHGVHVVGPRGTRCPGRMTLRYGTGAAGSRAPARHEPEGAAHRHDGATCRP